MFPEVVSVVDEATGTLGVSYANMVPLLIEALKEERAQRDALQRQTDTLMAEVARISEALARSW